MSILISGVAGIAIGGFSVWAVLGTRLKLAEELRQRTEAQMAEMEKKTALQFENLANRIFDEKNDRFKKESAESIGQLLTPLRERLNEFQKKVDESFGQQAREQITLKREIEHIISVNQKMTQQTESLTRALKGDVKAQGSWGEVILEKILEDSGLQKGVNYTLQGADMKLKHADDAGRLKPDVIVHLPEKKHIVIDSKVSLTAYERYCATEDVGEQARHLKDYLLSIRAHVNGLADRRYQDAGLDTPDFVLMFMPIEGAYSLAMQKDVDLHAYAWDKKVIIVCPTTLFATLKTIASVWRLEMQNRNVQEIARQGGALYDKVAGFVDDMTALGKTIGIAQKAYDAAINKLSTGTGNILARTQKLKELGAKTSKSLPPELMDSGDVPLLQKESA